MDIFFSDPSEVPLPPAEVRIRELKVEPWPDGKRLRVYLEVDPFQKKPNADLTLFDEHGRELSSAYVIESMTRKIELVMHLRGASSGTCILQAVLYYSTLPAPPAGSGDPGYTEGEIGRAASMNGEFDPAPLEITRQVVDTHQVSFEIPA